MGASSLAAWHRTPSIRRLALIGLVWATLGIACGPAQDGELTVRTGIEYARQGGTPLLLDAYLTAGQGRRPAIILIHGGGWTSGSRSEPTNYLGGVDGWAWARAGFVAFSVDYRLAPRFPYPAAVQDMKAAVRWVRRHADEYGVDPSRVVAFGHSAGGHLAAMLGVLGEGSLDTGSRVRVAVSWSGPLDPAESARASTLLAEAIAQFLECRIEQCADKMVEASPISYVDATDAAVLLVNSTEEFVPLDQAARLAETLLANGVPSSLVAVPGSAHAGYGEVGIAPSQETVWQLTIRFIWAHLGEPDGAD